MKKTILIVDDTELYLAMFEAAVKKLGFDAELCSDGAEAIPLLTQNKGKYAAVVLDVYMPLIDGISTLGHIRSNWPDLPVLMASGGEDHSDERSATQLGVLGFLKKPLSPEAIEMKLRELLPSAAA